MGKIEKTDRKFYALDPEMLIIGVAIIVLLYIISLNNYLLFHTLSELFSVFVAYIVFLVIWKSRNYLLNRYLLLIGVSYFFIGTFDLLHALTLEKVGMFPDFGINPSIQFWTIARYMESISFLIASLFLVQSKEKERKNLLFHKTSSFLRTTFLIYALISTYFIISVMFFKNFPIIYIKGSGITSFKVISESLITFIFFCSLVLLYVKKERFDREVFILIAISILLAIFGELPFITYSHMDNFPSLIGHLLKVLSFYFIYRAIVETGFEEPYRILFRELKQREEALTEEATFLSNEQMIIYTIMGVNKNSFEKKAVVENSVKVEKKYSPIIQNLSGNVFQLDKDLSPIFIGDPQEIIGYSKEDLLSGKIKWEQIIEPEDRPYVYKKVEDFVLGSELFLELEYRVRRKDGETRWVRVIIKRISENHNKREKFQGSIYDITERKIIEETVKKNEEARIKEIHHRIKNNLQVISSLLDLQAETFSNLEICKTPDVIEAFRESQNRVISMALIHEELYKSKDMATLDFGAYLQKLTANLLSLYTVENKNIKLKMNFEQIYLGMDVAIPLGIIVNELTSNSLKHAFKSGQEGEISLNLYRNENCDRIFKDSTDSTIDKDGSKKQFHYTLIIADNGLGIPEEIDIENTDSLGLQLVNLLVHQIEGHLELKRGRGTEFKISFNNLSNSDS